MIDIKDFKHSSVCYFGGEFKTENMSRHSIGKEGAPAYFRIDVCHTCLKEIITEGLKRLTQDEIADILKDYMPQEQMQDNGQYQEKEEDTKESEETDKEPEEQKAKTSYRDELIAKAKDLGIEGKLVTFSNKKLEREIKNKLGGK